MAPHSSTLAWKIPWTEEPGRLQSMGVTKSRTWLSDFPFPFHFHALEKEMATHSSVLDWRIPETKEPGRRPSMGSHRVRHDWSNLAAAAHASKVMLKILQASFQQYVNHDIPDVQADFWKGRGTRDQIDNIHWIIKKARKYQKKTSISALLTMPKPLTAWITTNCGNFLKEMGIPDHLNLPPENPVYGSRSNS